MKEIEDKKSKLQERLGFVTNCRFIYNIICNREINGMKDYDTSESKMQAIELKKKINKWEEDERQKQQV